MPPTVAEPCISRVTDPGCGQAVLDALVPHYRALGAGVRQRPLELSGQFPGLPPRLRIYVWALTPSRGERQAGAWKIQMTGLAPGRQPGRLDHSDGALVLIAGYNSDLDVVALWDAGLYDRPNGIAFSRNLQVLDKTLFTATAIGLAEQERRLRDGAVVQETIVAVSRARLLDGVQRRWELTLDRLTQTA